MCGHFFDLTFRGVQVRKARVVLSFTLFISGSLLITVTTFALHSLAKI